MNKTLLIVLSFAIIGVIFYGFNNYSKYREFDIKQKCHTDAIKYIDKLKQDEIKFEKEINDEETAGTLLLPNEHIKENYYLSASNYNKELNTCLVLYERFFSSRSYYLEDKLIPQRAWTRQIIYDLIAEKDLASWLDYDLYKTEAAVGGFIGERHITDINEYLKEKQKLMNTGEPILTDKTSSVPDTKTTETLTPSIPQISIVLPTLTPTPTYIPTPNPYANMPTWCKTTIDAYYQSYRPLNYSNGAINEIIKREAPECATY